MHDLTPFKFLPLESFYVNSHLYVVLEPFRAIVNWRRDKPWCAMCLCHLQQTPGKYVSKERGPRSNGVRRKKNLL